MNTQEMQNIYKWAWIVLIILAVFLGAQTLAAFKGLRDTTPSYNTINVSGEGEVFAVPDIASFTFTVSADARTVTEAQEQVTDKMDTILAEVKNLGVEEKDIKTTDYSVYPRYSYTNPTCGASFCPPSRQVLDGYTASHNVTVKVRKTDDAGKILAAAGDRGATGISSISFTVDDPEQLTSEARAMAIENAREKAEMLSDELDVRLVRVISFYDSTDGGHPMPMYGEGMGMSRDMVETQAAKAPELPSGQNKVKVVVNVTYEIR